MRFSKLYGVKLKENRFLSKRRGEKQRIHMHASVPNSAFNNVLNTQWNSNEIRSNFPCAMLNSSILKQLV